MVESNYEPKMSNELMQRYPDLYVSVYRRRIGGYSVAVWVERNGRDGEALGSFLTQDPVGLDLGKFQKAAAKAKKEGLHVCNRCLEAKECPAFWYAARYCRECLEADPELRARIAREDYR